ncbi:5-deoxy-glucuronate isomerase [Clostridium ganghwense]|uniref:5-deoxy-glucuronate isomerase n=1 Tax=Clostridium ganghwense TaxID=312089 RepID=A0ABT4CK66_9CLOT|nr:5-deoxy-glucuronate isomerase [Clostridium ganghwense]
MIERFGELKEGYNTLTQIDSKHSNMMMDIGIYKMKSAQEEVCFDSEKESAFLLVDGEVTLEWQGNKKTMKRNSVFDENPWCLHIPKNVEVKITSISEAEVLIQKTDNEKEFECKLYSPEDCRSDIFGEGVWNDTARRVVRTVFDYSNAPYSNLVMGEVINFPGKWSSYIPHHHPQPEVYYYKFNKPQGFGCSIIGDNVYKITNNSISAIPGGLVHPQIAAPGYAMYYCWMIRHLDNNPWTDRINLDEHKWLLDPDAKIWPDK